MRHQKCCRIHTARSSERLGPIERDRRRQGLVDAGREGTAEGGNGPMAALWSDLAFRPSFLCRAARKNPLPRPGRGDVTTDNVRPNRKVADLAMWTIYGLAASCLALCAHVHVSPIADRTRRDDLYVRAPNLYPNLVSQTVLYSLYTCSCVGEITKKIVWCLLIARYLSAF